MSLSNRDIDPEAAIGSYEFILTPSALFAPDGSMLPCTDKSMLIHNLEKLGNTGQTTAGNNSTTGKIAVVDGMVLE